MLRRRIFADVSKSWFWTRGHYSGLSRCPQNPIVSVLIIERQKEIWYIYKRGGVTKTEAETGKRQGTKCSWSLWRSEAPRTVWYWSNETEVELLASRTVRINFRCFQPPSLWYYVMAALGNEYTTNHSYVLRVCYEVRGHCSTWTSQLTQLSRGLGFCSFRKSTRKLIYPSPLISIYLEVLLNMHCSLGVGST